MRLLAAIGLLVFAALLAPLPAAASLSDVTQYCGDRVCPTLSVGNPTQHAARRAGATRVKRARVAVHGGRHRKIAPRPSLALDANGGPVAGLVRSGKTGAVARVAARFKEAFQAYVDDVEAAGGRITFMGGIRPGPCAIPWSKHPCGMAIDLCQYRRGIVDHACRLPAESVMAALAVRHGLIEGGVWCNGDRGHAEVRTQRQAEACRSNLYAAVRKFKKRRLHIAGAGGRRG